MSPAVWTSLFVLRRFSRDATYRSVIAWKTARGVVGEVRTTPVKLDPAR